MSKLVINSFEDFEKYVGQPLGESEYLQVDQERINLFADATLDHQWIHTDVERAQGKPVQEHHRTRLSDPLPPTLLMEPNH